MRRYLWGGALFVATSLALLALLPWAFSDALLRGPVVEQIEARTGLVAENLDRATIEFLPIPRLKFRHLKVRDKTGSWVVEARQVTGELRLLSLLTGHLELKSLTLERPDLAIDLDANPFGEGSAIARALRTGEGSLDAIEADAVRIGTLTVTGGRMQLRSRSRRFETTIENVGATLNWPSIGRPAQLSGHARWRGYAADFDATAAGPLALLRGQSSQVTLDVRSDLVNVRAAGTVVETPRKHFSGTIRVDTPSLRQLARVTGLGIPLPGPLDAASIAADAQLAGGRVWLTNAKLALDGNAFDGSLAVYTHRGRTAISGTLATDLLQLDTIEHALPPLRSSGGWSSDPLDLSELSRSDLDLRISAARAWLGGVEVEDAAFSVLLKGGRLEVSLADGRAYGGDIRLRGVGTGASPNFDLKIDGRLTNVDVGALLGSMYGSTWISGVGGGDFSFQTVGGSTAAIMAGLDGRADVKIGPGALIGIDLEQALRRIEKRPLLSALEIRSGQTSFDRLSMNVRVSRGHATIGDGLVTGPATRIAFGGTASIPERSIDLQARATQTVPEKEPSVEGPELKFYVRGTWDDPSLEPDAASLIRRSGAAAPLFAPRRESKNSLGGIAASPAAAEATAQ